MLDKATLTCRRMAAVGLVFSFMFQILQIRTTKLSFAQSSAAHRDTAKDTAQQDTFPFTARDYYPNHTAVPSWMEDYIQFHGANIIPGNHTHKAQLKPGAKFLQYTCTVWCGGVGDRMNGIMTLFYIAMVTERVLVINHPRPFPLTDVLVPNRIQWDVQVPPPGLRISAIDSRHLPKSKALKEPSSFNSDVQGIQVRINQWYGEMFTWNSGCMKQYWNKTGRTDQVRPADHVNMFRWGFWTLFRFHDNVVDRADQLKLAALRDHNSTENTTSRTVSPATNRSFHPYIAVHVRGERHVGEQNHRQFLQCAQNVQRAILEQQQHLSTKRLIYVTDDSYSSDRRNVKKTIQSWDPENVRINNIVVYHNDNARKTHGSADKNVDMFAEVVILIDSECLVRSRSGFSELAHRITLSNEQTADRCGLRFNECDDRAVQGAVNTLHWNHNQNQTEGWISWVPPNTR